MRGLRGARSAMHAALLVLAVASPARAQRTAELMGTYVRYVAVSANGVMVATDAPDGRACMPSCHCDAAGTACVEGRGMRYSDDGTAAALTCDAFYPRAIETFSVLGARGDGTTLRGHNNLDVASFVVVEGPTVSDRSIHWAGVMSDELGLPALRLDLDWDYQTDDRAVRLRATVTNLDADPVFDLYLLRNADPNFSGICPASGTGDASTANDVVRQPPAGGDALVTASAGGFVLGIGAHDDRARACTGGRENTDAVGEWNTPHDADGAVANVAIDVVFHETEIAAGDATTFELFYVWGTSEGEVEGRFDLVGAGASTCLGVADGIGCSSGSGASGICHGFACCTGCWDAAAGRCQAGTNGMRCGTGGGACASCDDGNGCTSDVCGLGACSNPPAPVATACEDGAFCTVHDTCDGFGHCRAGGANACDDLASCTADRCDETANACVHTLAAGCLVGGECVAEGARPTAYPCLVCDTTRSTTDWSALPSGTSCAAPRCSAGVSFTDGTCDAAGACTSLRAMTCASGACAADGRTCEPPCTATSCPDGQRCAETMRCVSLASNGATCGANGECSSGHCTDGVCCEESCDGLCAACDLPHQEGRCVAIPMGTDPARECASAALCDGHGACVDPMPDAGARRDAGTGSDAGMAAPTPRGCGCSAPGTRSGRGALVLAIAALGIVLARRRRKTPWSWGLALTAWLVPGVATATVLMSGTVRWDVDDAIGGSGEMGDGTSDAYDNCYYLAVASNRYTLGVGVTTTTSADGRQIDFPAAPVGTTGLTAERHVYVPATGLWARYVEVIENRTASPVSASVGISGNLGSDGGTLVTASSSGDATLTTADTWVATDDAADGSGDPSLAHVFRGAGGAVTVAAVSLATDALSYVYGVTVPAHGRVAILHFAVQAPNRATAQATATQLSMLPPETRIGADTWAPAIVNWAIGWADACATGSDGTACSSWAGSAGQCRGGTCCTGCWNGSACVQGTDVSGCGARGALCVSCNDGNACTDDACTSGACTSTSSRATTPCDDGAYCTMGDHCSGTGSCTPGTLSPCDDHMSCTADRCDESTRACTNTFVTGCIIGGECVGPGEHHVAYPCLVCDVARDTSDWSLEPTGTVCGSARCASGHLFSAGVCDDVGTCDAPRPTACASMACAGDGATCEPPCTATSCPRGQRCGAEMHCVVVVANGGECTSADQCESGACADGVCCERACDGTCESCDLPGLEGTCKPIPVGTDPASECGATRACDGHGACVGRDHDAGLRDGGMLDAGASDGGVTAPPRATSCGCRAPGTPRGHLSLLGFALLGLLVSRRRAAW